MRRIAAEKTIDLEAWEEGLLDALMAVGSRLLEKLLRDTGCGRLEQPLRCQCGADGVMQSRGQREKILRTLLGEVRVRRSIFACPSCAASRCLWDEELGVINTGFSPAVRRRMARAGSRTPFAEAAEDLRLYARLELSAKDVQRVAEGVGEQIQRWMNLQAEAALQLKVVAPAIPGPETLYISFDGTGAPIRRAELQGRRGKQADGSAKSREVKLGCVFTQIETDPQGYPVRQQDSTTYVGAIESSDAFGWRIFAEATRRGLPCARRLVVLTDGASYNQSIAQTHFPAAIHIIDLYHAREHLHELCSLGGYNPAEIPAQHWLALLEEGAIEKLVAQIQSDVPNSHPQRAAIVKALNYFTKYAAQMNYAHFRQLGLFIGSGVVEAGCRSLIGHRLKQSGMFWSVRGANAIIASRCCQFSHRFADFWEDLPSLAA